MYITTVLKLHVWISMYQTYGSLGWRRGLIGSRVPPIVRAVRCNPHGFNPRCRHNYEQNGTWIPTVLPNCFKSRVLCLTIYGRGQDKEGRIFPSLGFPTWVPHSYTRPSAPMKSLTKEKKKQDNKPYSGYYSESAKAWFYRRLRKH